jgi:methylase of polypeptide subunit release factors
LATDVLGKPKEYLIAHDNTPLSPSQVSRLEQQFARRRAGEPIAYIRGKKEFYGRDFIVTPDVLIPRPETESIIEVASTVITGLLRFARNDSAGDDGRVIASGFPSVIVGLDPTIQTESHRITRSSRVMTTGVADRVIASGATRSSGNSSGLLRLKPRNDSTTSALRNDRTHNGKLRLIDIGTGSGCIGITLKLEHHELDITLSDISQSALEIAKLNAKNLAAEVKFQQRDLLTAKNQDNYIIYDMIIANLPYVSKNWAVVSPELAYEPAQALYASDNGTRLIKNLIAQAPQHLRAGGYLIIELDPCQYQNALNFAAKFGFLEQKLSPDTHILTLVFHPEQNDPQK